MMEFLPEASLTRLGLGSVVEIKLCCPFGTSSAALDWA